MDYEKRRTELETAISNLKSSIIDGKDRLAKAEQQYIALLGQLELLHEIITTNNEPTESE